jgi:lipoprotein-releasing system ATP-binding protein
MNDAFDRANAQLALDCREVHRTFEAPAQDVQVLKGVWLSVAVGEVVAILGPSGSGKSTLLHLLAGLDRPTKGEIFWQDIPVHQTDKNRLAALRLVRLGLVFQHHYLLEDLTVFENITLSGRLQGSIDEARAFDLLARVGLEQRSTFLPRILSGGERQRVAVARALYHRPSLILADEPTGSLDRVNARVVYELLVELARQEQTAVVMVTHDEGLVQDIDRRYYLRDGVLEPN